MKRLLRVALPLLGVLWILITLSTLGGHGRLNVSFFLSLLFGGTLIASPFFALGIALMYLLMLVFIVGGPLLGAYIGVQIGGKDSAAVWIGLVLGGFVGFKVAVSDFFEMLMKPITAIANEDDTDK